MPVFRTSEADTWAVWRSGRGVHRDPWRAECLSDTDKQWELGMVEKVDVVYNTLNHIEYLLEHYPCFSDQLKNIARNILVML